MQIAYGVQTDVGLRRAQNEDSLCAVPDLGLFIVCDGMGGHNAGEVASRLAVQVIQKYLRDTRTDPHRPFIGDLDPHFSPQTNRLASAIRLANQAIYDAGRSQPGYAGMGTTVVSAMISDRVLSIAHVGDSRLYLIRAGAIQPLTADHSLVAEQVRRGLLTEEQAERSPDRHVLTRALGIDQDVEVELNEVHLAEGDDLLLCSDGLTGEVTPPDILRTIRSEREPQAACEQLVKMANAAGGHDNTTVIVITVR